MALLPTFVSEDTGIIIAELKADYEARTGKVLAPADVEMLLINAFAYREGLIRASINDAARQNLVPFSRGSILEYLGQLVGVSRLPAAGAEVTIRFTLVGGHTGVTIPTGLRVQSTDGKVIFSTVETKLAPVGTLTLDVKAECTTTGKIGNDYEINKIGVILDPLPYVQFASNIELSKGGADEETDDELRERIYLAPASFSVAGPRGAYKYFAKSAHPSIIDVSVTSPNPGEVLICPLLENGQLPTVDILNDVLAVCNADNVRPLTDTVLVQAPNKIDYAIEVDVTLINGAIQSEVETEINSRIDAFKKARLNKLGKDVVSSVISSLCIVDSKVYDVRVISPVNDLVVQEFEYSNCTGVIINIIGASDE
jgi:phage-related baseplate assembly protein